MASIYRTGRKRPTLRRDPTKARLDGKPTYSTTPRKSSADQKAAELLSAGADPKKVQKAKAAGLLDAPTFMQKVASNLKDAAIYTVPGTAQAVSSVARDFGDAGKRISPRDDGGDFDFSRTKELGKQTVRSTYDTIRHPKRRPGDTLLLGLAALSGGGSVASRLSAKSLRKPPPKIRKFKVGEAEAVSTYSKSPGRALVQEALDKRAVKLAEKGKSEALNARFARAASRNRLIEESAGRSPQQTIQHAGRKLTPGQKMALRAHVEQTPLAERMALAVTELKKAASPADRRRLRREIGLIRAAEPYVRTDKAGRVALVRDFETPRKSIRKGASPAELRKQSARVITGGRRREAQGVELGLLDEGRLASRKAQPGQIAREAAEKTEGAKALGYLGYGNRRARDVVFSPFASRSGARPKKSPELAGSLKEFGGTNLRRAQYEHDTSRVAASGMAAMNRHHQAVRLNERLFAAGVDVRPPDTLRTKYVPVRDRDLSPNAMNTLRALSEKIDADERLTGAERQAYERALHELETPELATDALNEPVGAQMEGVRWVPKVVFEKVSQSGQKAGSVATNRSTRIAGKLWHEFSAGLRALVLYSTGGGAGYITPNLAANVLLLAAQGGPKIIPAATKALNPKFRKAVGEDAWGAGLARMGGGFMTSTFSEQLGRGPVSAATRAWSSALGRVTDQETRMISLVYEAGERGYKSPSQFRSLMLDPKHADDSMDVTIRARDAALDYELISGAERQAIASWLFVYPFIRASSRYAINFPLDRPFQAAVYSQLAQLAAGNESLGERTDRDAGLVQVGTRDGMPIVINTNAVSPFTALPEVVGTLADFANPHGEPERGRTILDLANPAVAAAIETISGRDSFTGRPVPQNVGGFGEQVAGNIPLVRDVGQWRKTEEERSRQVSPRTHRDVIARQVAGSLAPRPYDVEKAERYAKGKKSGSSSSKRKGSSSGSIYSSGRSRRSGSIYSG